MDFNIDFSKSIFSDSKEIIVFEKCDKNVCLLKKPLNNEFLSHLKKFLPEIIPVSFRSGRGFELKNEKNKLPKTLSSFIVPGEYIGIESSTINTNLVNFLLSTIYENFNLNPKRLISSRFQFNIFPLNASYNILSLIPHVDLVSKNNNNIPIAININLNVDDVMKTGFFEYKKFNTKVYTKKFIEDNNLTGDFFNDFNFQDILNVNKTFSYSDEIKLIGWNKYQEIELQPGDISIYLGNYFHSPILNKNKISSNKLRISIAGFLIYADEVTDLLMRYKKSETLIDHKSLNGYRFES